MPSPSVAIVLKTGTSQTEGSSSLRDSSSSLAVTSSSALPLPAEILAWWRGIPRMVRPARIAFITSISFTNRSAPGRSALFTQKMSATSIRPAFIAWMPSPDSGTRTTTVESAAAAISSSD